MKKENDILRLNLETKWFEMTASGEKTEEYMDITLPWVKRLCFLPGYLKWKDMTGFEARNNGYSLGPFDMYALFKGKDRPVRLMLRNYDKVVFRKGHTGDTAEFLIEHIRIDNDGRTDWGAPYIFKPYFIIKLGKRIK